MLNIDLELEFMHPIQFYDVCTIYQPTITDIMQLPKILEKESQLYGENEFITLCYPFMLTTEVLNEHCDTQETLFNTFLNNQFMLSMLVYSLQYFCKTDQIYLKDNSIYFEGYTGALNNANFDEFCNIVNKICGKEKIHKQEEEQVVALTEEGKKALEILLKHRRENEKKNQTTLSHIIQTVQIGNKAYITEETLLKWSMYKLFSVYKDILIKEDYENTYSVVAASGCFNENKKAIEKHWTERLKISS